MKRFWLLLIIPLVLIALLLSGWLWLAHDLPTLETMRFQTPSIRILDRKGRLLYEVIDQGRQTVVPLAEIPQACIDATIATEDAGFYQNAGVSFRGMLRSLWINASGGEVIAGGSTITQQVARNTLLDPDEQTQRTVRRKMREVILAYRLTQRASKEEILALYLNQTYYGNLAYGIDAASRAYFGKPVSQLSLGECALLAGLPQAPSTYDPLIAPDAARTRQLIVLNLMQQEGLISPADAQTAQQQPLQYSSERYTIDAPHAVFAVVAELESTLPTDVIQQGGLEVHTSLDADWVRMAESISRRQLDLLDERDIPARATNAALVAINPQTGQVLALMGSPDYFDASISGAMNMALIPRQPGSTLKPFTYAALLDPTRPDHWTPATMMLDVRTSFVTHDGDSYTPVNYDGMEHGPVLMREALASSYNIPAVLALDALGTQHLLDFLHKLGISTLENPNQYDLALTLGGGEVSLLELTAAYGALANGGRRVEPHLIDQVIAADGSVLYAAPLGTGDQVLDARVAWLITDMLGDNAARTPGFGPHSVLQIGRPAAVKTGTTNDFHDNWTLGYTPDLVVGVWVGNASNLAMLEVSGVSGAGPIWHSFMREVLKGTPEHPFTQPPGLVKAPICALSGMAPGPDCPYTRTEWFLKGTEPTQPDTLYVRLGESVYLNLPPQAHDWARRKGLPLLPAAFGEGSSIVITSPEAQNIFRINAALPMSTQKLHLAADGPGSIQSVTFSIDGLAIFTDSLAPFETWWELAPGAHTVTVNAITATGATASDSVTFTVK